MDIDQRLEALTQSVELLASMHKDNEVRYEKRAEETDKQIKSLGRYIHTVAQFVIEHETRLRNIEGDDAPEEA